MLSDSPTAWPISKVDRSRAADEVMGQLAGLIREGAVEDGQRLPSEKRLGEAFGVSRPVVREALRGLRSLGLIVSRSGSGSFVSTSHSFETPLLLGRYPAPELLEVRTHLEVPGARLAALRATEEQLDEVRRLVLRMDEPQDHRAYARLDGAFHFALAKCTGNAVQARLVADLHGLIVENSDLALSLDKRRQAQATREHREIADAVIRHDSDAAARAMAQHLERVSRLMHSRFGHLQARNSTAPTP
jgi:DNA-binding FadR family transcriptional regulator